MNKFRITYQNNLMYLRVKLSPHQEINEKEVNLFSTKYFHGLMLFTNISKNQIELCCPNGIPLRKFLAKPINKNTFYILIAQILETLKSVETNNLQYQNLVLDMDHVMINDVSCELYIAYLPIINRESTASIFSSVNMLSIVEEIVRNTRADSSFQFIHDFVYFINGTDRRISYTDIREYISRVQPDVYPKISAMRNVYPARDQDEYARGLHSTPAAGQQYREEGTTLLNQNEGTTLLSDGDSTTVLSPENVVFPYLVRIKKNERITINKPVFRIGKEKSYVDYFVSDNNAVSRSHADIIKRDQKYFIYDNNSTNKTYVNGMAIPVQKEIELFDADQIVLGNEPFEFKIE